MNNFLPNYLCCLVTSGFILLTCGVAQAQSFEEAVRAARKADAQYASSQAKIDGKRVQASQSGAAFYPSGSFDYSQSSASSGTSRSLKVSQPLFSYDRYLTLKQSTPLHSLADVESRQNNADMTLRVFNSMAEIVRQREFLRANRVQTTGLEEQLRRSVRMRQLGQGTVTEVSDFEVRLSVAQANRVSLQNAQLSAERTFSLLTGLKANVATLSVAFEKPWSDTRNVADITAYVSLNAPSIVSAQRNLELAEIAAKKVMAQYLPQIVAQAERTFNSGSDAQNSSSIGVVLSAPIGINPFFENKRAAIEVISAQENLRYAQELATSEVTRLYEAVNSYRDEVAIRLRALDAARLAVEGNEKSYQGGVKTNIDVLTSYQNLVDAEVALVNSRLAKGDAELRMKLLLDDFSVSP
jgi:protease secretion system outer membrane protein